MKAGVTPVLNSAWWKANKGTLVTAQPLEGALKKYEAAKAAFTKAIQSPDADGYTAYMAAKTALAADVVKAVDAHISSINKTLHKDTVAGLNKYKAAVIPAEKSALDKSFSEYKARHEGVYESMVEALENHLKLLAPIAALSAKTVLEVEAKAPEADKALSEVTVAKSKANKLASDAAVKKATEVSAYIAGKHQTLTDAIAKRPTFWPFDKTKALENDKAALNKLSDKRSMFDGQIESNSNKVESINKKVQSVMSQARRVAEGTVEAQEALVGAFDRMVTRAFALAQANDVPAREMKAAISNLDGDLTAYKKAASTSDKAKHKKNAEGNLRMAKVQQGALKSALENGQTEIDGLMKSLPADIVKRDNPAFAKMFGEFDKAMKSFTEDKATLQKESDKLRKLGPEVGKLT